LETDAARLGPGGDGALDSGVFEESECERSCLLARNDGPAMAAEIEVVGRRGQPDASARPQRIERNFDEPSGIARKHP